MKFLKLLAMIILVLPASAYAVISIPLVQLPYLNPRLAQQLLAEDDARFSIQNAQRVIELYVPPSFQIIGHPRSWLTIRADCYNLRTVETCKRALELIVSTMQWKQQLGLTRMRIIKLEDIPYADPAPLDALVAALDYTNGEPAMQRDQVVAMLNQYLSANDIVDTPAESTFDYDRTVCMFLTETPGGPWPPYYVACRAYAAQLAALMRKKQGHGKAILRSPYGR
jgi:hypothetical protein